MTDNEINREQKATSREARLRRCQKLASFGHKQICEKIYTKH